MIKLLYTEWLVGRLVREFTNTSGDIFYKFVDKIPENRIKPVEKNMFQKSGDVFKEIGSDIWNGLETRADKATDSWYDFGNYLTLGSLDLGKNMGSGLRYNAENRMNSTLDYINWMTIGGVDTIKGVVFPEESFSKDHWVSSFNLATLLAGAGNARFVNTSTPNVSTKVPSVEKTPKTTSVPLVTRLPRLNTLTNIQEWFRVNVPEIGIVYDTTGGYHFMVRKGDGGGSGGSGVKDGKGTGNVLDNGTVWGNIKITQPFYDGTKIPKSFELAVDGEKFWVHPNGTKHMVEYITRDATTHGMPVNSQTLLSSFESSVKKAVNEGVRYEEIMNVGNWELIFSKPRGDGLLPVIKHAVYRP